MSIHTLRKRFVRDHSLPIQILQSPHFDYLIDLYEPLFQSKSKYKEFLNEVYAMDGEDSFLQYYNLLKDKVITHISQKESFKRFNQDRLDEYHVKNGISTSKLYHPDNHRKNFISVDLKKANFQALRFYDSDMLDGYSDYDSWIRQFTNSSHISNSKYFRQVIFGNLNPKKQQKIQTYIVHQFLSVILNYFSKDDIMTSSPDEIVISYEKKINLHAFKQEMEQLFDGRIEIHLVPFRLEMQDYYHELGFVKVHLDSDKVDFKCVEDTFMPQAFKTFFKQEIKKEDLAFYHKGFVSHFDMSVLEKYQQKELVDSK